MIQIACQIYLKALDTMKRTLDLVEFSASMDAKKFKYFRSQLMNYTYDNLKHLFKSLADEKAIKRCNCGASLRKGYSKCSSCGGSGWTNYTKK